jgi:hypothetical protein
MDTAFALACTLAGKAHFVVSICADLRTLAARRREQKTIVK